MVKRVHAFAGTRRKSVARDIVAADARRSRAAEGILLLWNGALINRLGGFVMPLLALYLTRRARASVEQGRAGGVGLPARERCCRAPWGGSLADRAGPPPDA